MSSENINKGRTGSEGYAIGNLLVYKRVSVRPPRKKINDADAELKRFEEAKNEALKHLDIIYKRTRKKAGSSNAEIFTAQSMILKDEDYISKINENIINEKKNAEWAVSDASRFFYEIFASIEDEAVRAKAQDLKDVSNRLILLLAGKDLRFDLMEPVILAANYLSPTELMQLNRKMIKGIVMNEGSAYSHAVILAKTLGIPVVLGVNLKGSLNGHEVIVDGNEGLAIVDPDEDTRSRYTALIDNELSEKSKLLSFIGRESVTLGGKKIPVLANIGGIDDASVAMANDCEGVGLVRTEFMFLNRDTLPSEEEHFVAYKEILKVANGRDVVFRTLDIGADKKIAAISMKPEENPALGRRAIRLCLTDRDLFIPQLKGLLRAALYGNMSVMYPMITSKDEILKLNDMVREAREELSAEGIPYGEIKCGIMIETPAAALVSDELAGVVDFFSIGTNDLTQYTLAIDRQNNTLASFYNPYHEAVMKMIDLTIKNAHKAGIKVTVCGELAADVNVTGRLVEMGVDALSVSPKKVLKIRRFICSMP